MLLSRWFRRRRPAPTFRPMLLVLEDRTVPSGFGSHHFTPGPAAHLQVVVPENVQSGSPFTVRVVATDASNHPATGYDGTVTLSLQTTDSNATLPNPYTFTASDHGTHLFQVTLGALGSQTILVSGTPSSTATTPLINSSATTTVQPAPQLSQLLVLTPEQTLTGVPTRVTVVALDAAGHPLKNFTGTVSLATSDTNATGLPASYTFTTADHSRHSFQVSFQTADTPPDQTTVTATSGSITNQASLTVTSATTVTHFRMVALPVALTGSLAPVMIVALNAANQVVKGYTGTVTFTSTDTAATVSDTKSGTQTSLATFTYTFTTADSGRHLFWVTFGTTGKQTLSVNDQSANVTSSSDFWVLGGHVHSSASPGHHG